MTTQEAIEYIKAHCNPDYPNGKTQWDTAMNMAIEALNQSQSNDLISRSKAIRWVKAECNPYGQPTLDYESGIKVIEHLERMSSAQPYTESEIQTMQDLEQAQLDKAYELGWKEGREALEKEIWEDGRDRLD